MASTTDTPLLPRCYMKSSTSIGVEFECRRCSKITVRKGPGQKYCTKECQIEYNREHPHHWFEKHSCLHCDTVFHPKFRGPRKFCSESCRIEAGKIKAQRRRYGDDIPLDQACAICESSSDKSGRRLSVDHDHKTGKIRGRLCNSCNFLLGHANDDPERLIRAAEYLLHHGGHD